MRIRLYLLVASMFTLLYGVIAGIGYLLGVTGLFFYIYLLGFAAALVGVQYMVGPKAVEWSMRVRYVDESEYPRLHRMVSQLADKAGIPKPRVGLSRVDVPNAFAFGKTKRDARVCVTKGLLKLLTEEELKAVLGHEISHIKHRDVAVITMLSVIPMVCYMMYISFLWGGMFSRGKRDSGILVLIGFVALVLYFLTSLLVMYGSRIREYYADVGSVKLGNHPSKLANALYKLVYGSMKADRDALRKVAGLKAFFVNDVSRSIHEIRELRDIDLDMSGTIDEDELRVLSQRRIRLSIGDRLMEMLSTHPNMVKRIKHLSSLEV